MVAGMVTGLTTLGYILCSFHHDMFSPMTSGNYFSVCSERCMPRYAKYLGMNLCRRQECRIAMSSVLHGCWLSAGVPTRCLVLPNDQSLWSHAPKNCWILSSGKSFTAHKQEQMINESLFTLSYPLVI